MKRRNKITTDRGRIIRLIKRVRSTDEKCCVWLHITGSIDHNAILDELFEDIGKAYKRLCFPTIEIPNMPCIRSEKTGCIAPKDTAIVNGKLRDIMSLQPSTYVSNAESHIWHFAGGIWLFEQETCFCEYDADKKEGGMLIVFDGVIILWLLEKYPQLKQRIKIIKPDQYSQLLANW